MSDDINIIRDYMSIFQNLLPSVGPGLFAETWRKRSAPEIQHDTWQL